MTVTRPLGNVSAGKADPPTIEWVRVQAGLWVGKSQGEFAGMIESRGAQFAAIRLSQVIGIFDSLSEAKRSFS